MNYWRSLFRNAAASKMAICENELGDSNDFVYVTPYSTCYRMSTSFIIFSAAFVVVIIIILLALYNIR